MKFPYYMLDEYGGNITGINTEKEAREAAEWAFVIDAEKGIELGPEPQDDTPIKEYEIPIDTEDSTELPASLTSDDSFKDTVPRKE